MKRVLFMVYSLQLGGIEKAMVSLLNSIHDETLEITLLLVKNEGVFLSDVPNDIRIQQVIMPEFLRDEICMSTQEMIKKYIKNGNILLLKRVLKKAIKRKISNLGMNEIMQAYFAEYNAKIPELTGEFDIAIDYQGQGSFPTYYIANKVKAAKKYSWIHNDFKVTGYNEEDWLCELYHEYDKIVSVSSKACESFEERLPIFKDKAKVCYNVLSVENIKKSADEFEVVKKGRVNIVTVGRLSYQKGYDIALSAVARLISEYNDIHYYIVGEGEDRIIIANLIKDLNIEKNVTMTGFEKNPYPYIKAADIYLQPSRFEGFCITLGEAKILEKPIVTTDFAGADEQITNGTNGMIVRCDENEIFNALYRMITNKDIADGFVKNLSDSEVKDIGLKQFYELIQN